MKNFGYQRIPVFTNHSKPIAIQSNQCINSSFIKLKNMQTEETQQSKSGIREIARNAILNDMLRSDNSIGKWKIMVIDYFGQKVLKSCMKMSELIDENITLIEPLEKLRNPHPDLEAIYFIRPTKESIKRVIHDLTPYSGRDNKRLYAAAHLFFISELQESDFHMLKVSTAYALIKTMCNLNLDYLPLESQFFQLDQFYAFQAFYGRKTSDSTYDSQQLQMAKSIASFCKSIGEFPFIKFWNYGRNVELNGKTAALVYRELHAYAKKDMDFPRKNSDGDYHRSELIIIDRSADMNTTILHEFTYQAMINDMLQVADNGRRYEYKQNEKKKQYDFDGDLMFFDDEEDESGGEEELPDINDQEEEDEKQVVLLDENLDQIWASIRHSHIAECVNEVMTKFQEFTAANGMNGSSVSSVDQLKELLSNVPELQEMKAKFSAHINISQKCLEEFKEYKVDEIAILEQELVTGYTIGGEEYKNIEGKMIPLLKDPDVRLFDKIRMLILYIINHGVLNDKGRALFRAVNMDESMKAAIANLSCLGVNPEKPKGRSKKLRKLMQQESKKAEYELSRYKPVIKRILENAVNEELDENVFPYIKDPNDPRSYGSWNLQEHDDDGASVATKYTKPKWHLQRRKGSEDTQASSGSSSSEIYRPGKLIFFVIGGVSYAEIRSAYEVTKASGKEVILGSTHVATPEHMVNQLRSLDQKCKIPAPPQISFDDVDVVIKKPKKKEPKKKKVENQGAVSKLKSMFGF